MTEGSNNERAGRLPHHFVSFVEIFFAVVLGGSILELHTFLFPPNLASPSFWALITVYFTAGTSWIGWHKSTRRYPYSDSRIGYVRSVLDALIVGTYAALLFFGSRADKSFVSLAENNSLCWYLWGFVVVFVLYLVSGLGRRADYPLTEPSKVSQTLKILLHGLVMLVGATVYTVFYTVLPDVLFQLPTEVLWVFLLLPFAAMFSFRLLREWRGLRWRGRTTLAVDMDGVLVEQVVPVLEKLNQEMGLNLQKSDITHWEYPFEGTNIKIEIERAEQSEEFVRQMPLMKGAVEAMQALIRKFDVIIATSREARTNSWSLDWLDKHGIPHKRLVNTCLQGKSLPDADLLIDDYIGNIEEFIRDGPERRQAILFAQPWNEDRRKISDLVASGRVKIANDWQSILATLGWHLSKEETSGEQ